MQDLWDSPAAVADLLNLDSREMSYWAITTTTTVENAALSGHWVKSYIDRREQSSLIPECTDLSDKTVQSNEPWLVQKSQFSEQYSSVSHKQRSFFVLMWHVGFLDFFGAVCCWLGVRKDMQPVESSAQSVLQHSSVLGDRT